MMISVFAFREKMNSLIDGFGEICRRCEAGQISVSQETLETHQQRLLELLAILKFETIRGASPMMAKELRQLLRERGMT